MINDTQNKIIFHSLFALSSVHFPLFHFLKKIFAFNKLNDELNKRYFVRYFHPQCSRRYDFAPFDNINKQNLDIHRYRQ